jgi:hypothetical protein
MNKKNEKTAIPAHIEAAYREILASRAAGEVQGPPLDPRAPGLPGALILVTIPASDGFLASARGWNGGMDARFAAADNFVNVIQGYKSVPVPAELVLKVVALRDKAAKLIQLCRSSRGALSDRGERDSTLAELIDLCTGPGKSWAYEMHATGQLTDNDVHALGFLLLKEHGGYHERNEPTKEKALVKVEVKSVDFVEVVVDQSAGENAAQVKHGWPRGVKYILILIHGQDGKEEVVRKMSTRKHNEFHMPEGSRGKYFVAKAAFLVHVDDDPHFGNREVFFMPHSTEDLLGGDKQE